MSAVTQTKSVESRNIFKYIKPIGLVVILAIFALIPVFVNHSPYMLDLFIIMIINAVLAMVFISLFRTGLIFLAVCTFYGIGAYASIVFTMHMGMNFWIALPLSAIISAAIALILSPVLLGKTTSALQFIVITSILGMMFSLAVGNTKFLGGYSGVQGIPRPDSIFGIDFASKDASFYLELVLLVITVALLYAFYSAWTGRAWTSIGLSSRLAESIGINIFRYRLTVFVLGAFLVGMFGSFYAHYIGYISPDTFGMWQNMYVQLYAILGGLGFPIFGPIVGAAIMSFVPEYLRVLRQFASLFVGVILVLLILYLPQGILGIRDFRVVKNFFKSIENALSGKPKEEKLKEPSNG
jgi:branched-chain amino acid transport system permease protein